MVSPVVRQILLDCSGVREIHCVAVGLEDLSGVVTATADLVHAGLLPADAIPWTVSLHDLRVICEITDRPAELMLYLRRRTEPETTIMYQAVDELDLYMHFLDLGLFVEPDPAKLAEKYPLLGAPSVAALRRRKAEHPAIILSRTGPLDDWYNHQQHQSHPQPPTKPTFHGASELLALIDALANTRAPGWLGIATTMLEANAVTQRRFGTTGSELCYLTRRDGRPHDAVQILRTNQGPVVLIWHTYTSARTVSAQTDLMRHHVAAKKYQLHAAQAAGFLHNAQTGDLETFIYNNTPHLPDPQLDEAIKKLRPIEDSRRTPNALAAIRRKPERQH